MRRKLTEHKKLDDSAKKGLLDKVSETVGEQSTHNEENWIRSTE